VSDQTKALIERYSLLVKPLTEKFVPGQCVCWKPGLRNRRMPRDGEPAVVLEVLEDPRYDETKDAGNTSFFEPLDIVLGIIEPEGDFIAFHYDSRRFQPWSEDG
jgi:hypothetical protein